jgi:BirA family transcriptional regulator, biotin operon repressor / biotin---[acetyl-CoA-carboxylase] ligase
MHAELAIEFVDEIDSTNSELLRRAHASEMGALMPMALVAARQTAGRGRSGRVWLSPAGIEAAENLCLSMLLPLAVPLRDLAPFTLALGVAARRAISPQLGLKWPNDLLLANRKVGGILVEVARSGLHETDCWVVAGIGVNIQLPPGFPLNQASTDLVRHGIHWRAADLAREIVTQWQLAAVQFSASRLRTFLADYEQADALLGQALEFDTAPTAKALEQWRGAGLAPNGALRVQNSVGELRTLNAGEVRVRLASPVA